MDYKLAKQLKDAGFPQEARWGTFFYKESGNLFFINEDLEGLTWEDYVRCPTLSELIEACGKNICCFHFFPEDEDGNKRYGADTWSNDGITRHFYGETPEEAVAKLWLELYYESKRN